VDYCYQLIHDTLKKKTIKKNNDLELFALSWSDLRPLPTMGQRVSPIGGGVAALKILLVYLHVKLAEVESQI
jgi:hypothetical protein